MLKSYYTAEQFRCIECREWFGIPVNIECGHSICLHCSRHKSILHCPVHKFIFTYKIFPSPQKIINSLQYQLFSIVDYQQVQVPIDFQKYQSRMHVNTPTINKFDSYQQPNFNKVVNDLLDKQVDRINKFRQSYKKKQDYNGSDGSVHARSRKYSEQVQNNHLVQVQKIIVMTQMINNKLEKCQKVLIKKQKQCQSKNHNQNQNLTNQIILKNPINNSKNQVTLQTSPPKLKSNQEQLKQEQKFRNPSENKMSQKQLDQIPYSNRQKITKIQQAINIQQKQHSIQKFYNLVEAFLVKKKIQWQVVKKLKSPSLLKSKHSSQMTQPNSFKYKNEQSEQNLIQFDYPKKQNKIKIMKSYNKNPILTKQEYHLQEHFLTDQNWESKKNRVNNNKKRNDILSVLGKKYFLKNYNSTVFFTDSQNSQQEQQIGNEKSSVKKKKERYYPEQQLNKYSQKQRLKNLRNALKQVKYYQTAIEVNNYRNFFLLALENVDLRCFFDLLYLDNQNITKIKLVKVGLTDYGFNVLLNFLPRGKNIDTLVLTNNELTSKSLNMIKEFSEQNNMLKNIYILHNRISSFKKQNNMLINIIKGRNINIYV